MKLANVTPVHKKGSRYDKGNYRIMLAFCLTCCFVAKLFAYGFDDKALRFVYDYLRHRKQRTKIADSYSSWQEILYGVPQGSVLGPLLFNADLRDFFITMSQYDIR